MPIARALGLYRTTYISPNVSRFLGYPADMFVADPDFWADLIHRDDRDWVVAGLAQLPEVGHIHHEYRMRHKSGAWRWVRDQVSLVRGDRNNPAYDYLAGIWIDVTADMLALEESEDRLRDYAESADDWFWETDEQFRFVEAWSGTSGVGLPFDRDSFRGLTRLEIAHEATDNQKWRDHQTALENHAPFRDFVYTRTDGEGRCRHIRVSGRPVFDDNGVFRGHRGAGSDVTKETEAEQILLSSEARFRTLVETSTQGILVLRFDDLLFANQAFADILGYADPDAIMALGSAEAWLPGDENTRMRGYAEERLRGGTAPDRYEFRGIRKDGSTVWLENNSALIEWEGETAILSTNTDITARHEAQEATKASELLYRSILDSMMDVYSRSDKGGRLVMVSPSMKDLLGYDVAESIGMEIADLYVEPEGPDQFTAALKASNGNLRGYEVQLRHKDGHVVWVSGNGQFCYDENNTVIGLDGTVRDITERRQLEQALRDSESQFRGLFENTKVGIAIRRGEKIVFANQAFAQQFGYDTPSDLTALASITEILSEEERARFRQIYEQRDRGEAPEYSEFRGLHKDGSTIWIEQWAKESPGKAAPRILPSQ